MSRLTDLEQQLASALQALDTRFLLALAHADVDPAKVARHLLADRGTGPDGRWLGLAEAYRALGLAAET